MERKPENIIKNFLFTPNLVFWTLVLLKKSIKNNNNKKQFLNNFMKFYKPLLDSTKKI